MNAVKSDDENKETEKLEEININRGVDEGEKSYLEYAQKEMEIIVSLVQNLTKVIMQSRYFLILSLTLLFGYLLKINRDLDPIIKIYFLLFGLLLILIFLANEIIVTTWQRAHMNRLWQLDKAINKRIIADYEKLQGIIFKRKDEEKVNFEKIAKTGLETMGVFSLFVFYVSLILLVFIPTLYVWLKNGLWRSLVPDLTILLFGIVLSVLTISFRKYLQKLINFIYNYFQKKH